MLIPVLNKESTAQELASLCWLLDEVKTTCVDVNLRWKVCQLAYNSDELYEKFLDENSLFQQALSIYNFEYFQQLPLAEKVTAMLSSAFSNAATIDAAHFESFSPDNKFKATIKLIAKQTLSLLQESKGWRPEGH